MEKGKRTKQTIEKRGMKANDESRRLAFLRRMVGDDGPPSSNQPTQNPGFIHPDPVNAIPINGENANLSITQPSQSSITPSCVEIEKLAKENTELRSMYERLSQMAQKSVQQNMFLEKRVKRSQISNLMTDSGILKSLREDLWADPPECIEQQEEQEDLRTKILQAKSSVVKKVLKRDLEMNQERIRKMEEARKTIFDILSYESSKFFSSMLLDENRCQLLELLGQGGFSCVWKAWDYEIADYVAVKLMTPKDHGNFTQFPKHIKREIDIMQATSHKNVVKMYRKFKVDEQTSGYIMEYCENGDLNRILKNGKLNEYDSQQIIAQIIDGILSLRCKSDNTPNSEIVIHYDLKPANILFDKECTPKIADFGLSKISTTGEAIQQSTPGTGTAGYTAPENFDGKSMVSPSADTWSIGIILYEMLTCDFDLKMQLRYCENINVELEEAFKKRLKNASDESKNFIRICLKKNSEERPTIKQLSVNPYITNQMEKRPKTPKKPKPKNP